jgi:hypothetical protein
MKPRTIAIIAAAWIAAGFVVAHVMGRQRGAEMERAATIMRERWERGRFDGPASRGVTLDEMGFDS